LSSGQWTAREVRKIAVVSSIHDANTLAIAWFITLPPELPEASEVNVVMAKTDSSRRINFDMDTARDCKCIRFSWDCWNIADYKAWTKGCSS
jgi:hypothetical protein